MTNNNNYKITIKDHASDSVENFYKDVWHKANLDYFGKQIDWNVTTKVVELYNKEKLVGVIELRIQVGVMYIFEIAVAYSHQKKGIGTMLMEKAEDIAKEMKLHKIYLETGKTWGTNKFYEKIGYKQTGIFPKHFGGHDYIQYSKFLPSSSI